MNSQKALIVIALFLIIQLEVNCLVSNATYTKKKRNNKPYIVAHRGASGHLPEHTLQGHATAM